MQGRFGRDPKPLQNGWREKVEEILELYMEVTDPKMNVWSNTLTFVKKCQAITKIAEVNGRSWIPFTGEDPAAMSSTGKPVTDLFRPRSQMRNGSHHRWSCYVHIVSDSTIVFKDASGAPKSSLIPEFNLRQSVFGSVQAAISGAQIKGIAGASANFRWGEQ
eukprot:7603076-Pyramimonas_sp.AAC.1